MKLYALTAIALFATQMPIVSADTLGEPAQAVTVCQIDASFGEGSSSEGVAGLEQALYERAGVESFTMFSGAYAGARVETWEYVDDMGIKRVVNGFHDQLDMLTRHTCSYILVGLSNDVWKQETRSVLYDLPWQLQARIEELYGMIDKPIPPLLYMRYVNADVDNPFIAHVLEPGYREFVLAYEAEVIASGGHVVDGWLGWQPSNAPNPKIYGGKNYHPSNASVALAADAVLDVVRAIEACKRDDPNVDCPSAYYTGMWAGPLPAFYGPR